MKKYPVVLFLTSLLGACSAYMAVDAISHSSVKGTKQTASKCTEGFEASAEEIASAKSMRGLDLGSYDRSTHTLMYDQLSVVVPSIVLLAHELCHAANYSQKDVDREISEITNRSGVHVMEQDLMNWGKEELLCDLKTLEVMVELGMSHVIKSYYILKELRQELVKPFYIESMC